MEDTNKIVSKPKAFYYDKYDCFILGFLLAFILALSAMVSSLVTQRYILSEIRDTGKYCMKINLVDGSTHHKCYSVAGVELK